MPISTSDRWPSARLVVGLTLTVSPVLLIVGAILYDLIRNGEWVALALPFVVLAGIGLIVWDAAEDKGDAP